MFGSQILDVAIGLVFVYLLVSLIVSIVNEWIARASALRASTLEDGLRNLLQDPQKSTQQVTSVVDYLYNHPLIQGASPLRNRAWFVLPRLPTPPAGTKTKGLPGPATPTESTTPEDRKPWSKPALPDPTTATGRPSYIDARNFSLALLDLVAPKGTHSKDFDLLKTEINGIPYPRLKQTLLALVDSAQTDVESARTNIETWFNNGMERVSGWYKRKVQIIGLCVALILAMLLNVDTFAVVRTLWTEPTVRDALAQSAVQYVQKNTPDTGAKFDEQRQTLETSLGQLNATNLPIGWILDPKPTPTATTQGQPAAPDPRRLDDVFSNPLVFLSKLVGLLLTGAAVSLGAHFWFDALKSLTSLRSNGNPPATDDQGT